VNLTANYPAANGLSAMFQQIGSAGGGGYTGGASSGLIVSSYVKTTVPTKEILASSSGGGGAGSNYTAGVSGCFPVNSAAVSLKK
jgi:hypothetical protein